MISHVSKRGDSLGLRIPSALARTLTVSEGGAVDLRVEGGSLVVMPFDDKSVYRLDDLLAGMDPDAIGSEVEYGGPVGDEAF